MAVSLTAEIFRTYDIRGIVGQSLDEEIMRLIGLAIGSFASSKGVTEIVVGRDGRLSGEAMMQGLVTGLLQSGLNVDVIGIVPTPVLYYGAHLLPSRSGVVVTGSHNPPDYNGIKMVIDGETLYGDAIDDLYRRIVEEDFTAGEGQLAEHDISANYLQVVQERVKLSPHQLKVVVDCGNGVTGAFAPQLYQSLGCEVIPLYTEVDGSFPNHHPDPSDPHNLQELIARVRQEKADFGFAFDGDGDRLGVVTDQGEIIWPDRLTMLFAGDILGEIPDASFIYDVKCTRHLQTVIEQAGGSAIMWRTGHSLVKAKLKETGAELAAEMSGHFFFNDRWFGFDDALYAGARLIEAMSRREQSLSEVFKALPDSFNTPEIKIAISDADKHDFVDRLIAKADFAEAKITTLDGLRVDFSNGFALVRASNTTPCLVCRFEADDEAGLALIQQKFSGLILSVDESLNLNF